jgi:hypothetical protein
MDTPLHTAEFPPVSFASEPSIATSGRSDSASPLPDADVRTHVLTTAATRRMPSAVPSEVASPAPPSREPSFLDALLIQLAGPALVAAGLVRLLYRAEWTSALTTAEGLRATELWSLVLSDLGVVGLLVCLWVAAWRRAHAQAGERCSCGSDLAALLLFIPVLGLSIPSIGLAAVGLSAMLTTFAALFGGAVHARDRAESRWGEAAFGSFVVVLMAAGVVAGGTVLAAGIAFSAAALVAIMGAATAGASEEAAAAH